jgi:hypothetical protein
MEKVKRKKEGRRKKNVRRKNWQHKRDKQIKTYFKN